LGFDGRSMLKIHYELVQFCGPLSDTSDGFAVVK
jgi:hypothetical protein